MPDSSTVAIVPLTFIGSLLILAWLGRLISIHIQIPVYYGTRSKDAPTVVLFLVFLPGVFIHEFAHWFTAKLCGLKTDKFRVWPTRRGRHIGLGSVNVESGGAVVDSLVGFAPLLFGTLVIGLISHYVFDSSRVMEAVTKGNWRDVMEAFRTAFSVNDGLLWAYLLFTVANSMMPSSSDREAFKPVVLYAIIAIVLYFVMGLPTSLLSQIVMWALPTLQSLTSAFIFTILLDTLVLFGLFALQRILRMK